MLEYRKCLAAETQAQANGRNDPRQITNAILKSCEDKLPAIKTAFDAENVPATISERYIRKTRSQGLQSVLRAVEAAQAQRAAEEEDAKETANSKKSAK